MSIIEIKNVVKIYGDIRALDDVTISIPRGEIFGLLGPNGAGKSTLISVITTLVNPESGDVLINGKSVKKNFNEVKPMLGLVPQDIALYGKLSAKENLEFFGSLYGLRGKELKNRVNEVLEAIGLKDRANGKIETFSGGMKRRINIAAALLHKPEILIMDEPTVGVDPQSRNYILEYVKKLNKEGVTVVYTSHYMEEVEFLCNKVAIIDHGKIIANGTKEELKHLVGNKDTVVVKCAENIDNQNIEKEILKNVPQAESVNVESGTIKIILKSASENMAGIVLAFENMKIKINSLTIEETDLEAVFLHLTGRALRD